LKKEKVFLIDLGTGTDRSLLPLACGLISAYAQSQPDLRAHYDFEIKMLGEGLDELLEEIVDPAVVGVSCYVWNFFGSIEISRRIKDRYPNVLLVLGGPSIPQREARIGPFLQKYPFVDLLVQGEGELTFADVLSRRIHKAGYQDCHGISLRVGGGPARFLKTPNRERIKDFTLIPSPFLTGIFDPLIERYGSHIVGALWETNRGCPFKCAFCDWGSALVNKVNRLELDRVVKEIEWVAAKKIPYVYATDANFGIFLQRDLEIARSFVEISKRRGFPSTLVLNWTKNSHDRIIDLATVFAEGKVITNVTLSFQSFNESVQKAILRDNIKVDVYRKLKASFHLKKLPTYTEVILGLPEETLETFVDGIDQALSPRLEDQLSIYLCVILENTHLQLPEVIEKYGIETRECAVGLNRRRFKYPRFGIDEIVVATKAMPQSDWNRAYEIAFTCTTLYNLRVAFFPIVFLNRVCGAKITDFIQFVLNTVDRYPGKYPAFERAIKHLRRNRQLILDNVASVSPVEGGDGVALTPHEAMAFLLYSDMEQTYSDLTAVVRLYCDENAYAVCEEILDDLVKYQKARIPVFDPKQTLYRFRTNVPAYLEAVTSGRPAPEIEVSPTAVEIKYSAHNYRTEVEFNLRRVACGYTLNVADAVLTNEGMSKMEATIPYARNPNLAGKFVTT
jgi:putative methyltransferase